MATGGQQLVFPPSEKHGYPQSIFITQSLDKKYLCTHCGEVLNDPIQSFCGHRYCSGCFHDLISSVNTRCQACLTEDDDSILDKDQTFPDNATRKELDELIVTCSNVGCSFKGRFSDYRKSHEKSCEYRQVKCPKCLLEVSPRTLADHERDKCPMRSVPCRYCNKTFIAKDNWSHNGKCPKFPIRCDFCDNLPRKIARDKMPEHLRTCKRDKAVCKFGCKDKYEVNKEEQHMQENAVLHLDLVRGKMDKLVIEIEQKRKQGEEEHLQALIGQLSALDVSMKACQVKVTGLNKKVAVVSRRAEPAVTLAASPPLDSSLAQMIDELKTQEGIVDSKITTFEGIVAVLNREVEKCSTLLESYEGQRRLERETLENNERKIKSLERVIALKDVSLAEQDLRIQALENASYDGILIWKIPEFSRKRHDAVTGRVTSLYSQSFYTGVHGYKMCCRIYLNGDGMGKGSHVSLFFVVMRGQYDALLRWPFKQKVTFMLLDQNNREHIIDAFRPDPTSSSFKRPTSEMNIASGCPLFMPLTQLDKQGTAYVKDDTMYLKVVVDVSDL